MGMSALETFLRATSKLQMSALEKKGMTALTIAKSGLGYEASIGGRKFSYRPVKYRPLATRSLRIMGSPRPLQGYAILWPCLASAGPSCGEARA